MRNHLRNWLIDLRSSLSTRWPAVLALVAALGALLLLWRVSDTPLLLGPAIRVDALSAFFAFATFGGAALALAAGAPPAGRRLWRMGVAALLLLAAYCTGLTLGVAVVYLLVALIALPISPATAGSGRGTRPHADERGLLDATGSGAQASENKRSAQVSKLAVLAKRLRAIARTAPALLAAGCLLLGYGALALRGGWRYDDRAAGAALDSFVFWFTLLAAVIPATPLLRLSDGDGLRDTTPSSIVGRPSSTKPDSYAPDIFRIAWLYPLARLYSLGPWNAGWSYATVLLGGAAALWCAASALGQAGASARAGRVAAAYLGLTLAGLGLGTSAGVAAGCYGVLAYLVLAAGMRERDLSPAYPFTPSPLHPLTLAPWLISGAFPFAAPFVAAWMVAGAGVAGGVALLAGAAWLVALLDGLAVALWGRGAGRRLALPAAVSVALGVGVPLVASWLIGPVVEQLQGGLTPYGELNIWPWVGLAARDAAHTQVTTLPSVALALLMLVLSALVYVAARLREDRAGPGDASDTAEASAAVNGGFLASLRDDVPWLAALLGPPREEPPRDGE